MIENELMYERKKGFFTTKNDQIFTRYSDDNAPSLVCFMLAFFKKKMFSSPASKKAAGIANIEVAERRLMLVEEVLLVKLFLNFLWRILVVR